MASNGFNKTVNQALAPLDNPIAKNVLRVLFFLYAAMAAPRLPPILGNLFDYALFRIAMIFLIVWTSTKDPTLSMMIAIGIVAVMNILSGRMAFETFLPEQNTNTRPSCLGVTLQQILDAFNGDEDVMKQAMYNAGVPNNIEMNDTNAPLLATYLLNYGYNITDDCSAPKGDPELFF